MDEYEAEGTTDLKDPIRLLQDLSPSKYLKICVSSRPWNVFSDAFSHDDQQFLKLDDLTRRDIESYVRDKFQEHPGHAILQEESSQYTELIQEVAIKSKGVFLWVYLVMNSLLDGLTNADHVPHLQKRLHETPADLEPFFQQILDSIDPFYQEQSLKSFRLPLDAQEPPSLFVYSFLEESVADFAMRSDLQSRGVHLKAITERRLDAARRRLNACSKGLLEVSVPKIVIYDASHQTVTECGYCQGISVRKLNSSTGL